MDSGQIEQLLAFCKALADESRLRILGLLARKEATGEELAAILNLDPATISHHMRRLSKIALIDARPESYYTVYRLNTQRLHELAKQLFSAEALATVSEDLDVSAYDKKVLQNFMTGPGRLKAIPAQRKKRAAILRHIAQEFKAGRVYSEGQLNNVLKRFHSDTATLRREMIAEKLLEREDGKYWTTS